MVLSMEWVILQGSPSFTLRTYIQFMKTHKDNKRTQRNMIQFSFPPFSSFLETKKDREKRSDSHMCNEYIYSEYMLAFVLIL